MSLFTSFCSSSCSLALQLISSQGEREQLVQPPARLGAPVQLACLFLTSQHAGVRGCWVANSGFKKKKAETWLLNGEMKGDCDSQAIGGQTEKLVFFSCNFSRSLWS